MWIMKQTGTNMGKGAAAITSFNQSANPAFLVVYDDFKKLDINIISQQLKVIEENQICQETYLSIENKIYQETFFSAYA